MPGPAVYDLGPRGLILQIPGTMLRSSSMMLPLRRGFLAEQRLATDYNLILLVPICWKKKLCERWGVRELLSEFKRPGELISCVAFIVLAPSLSLSHFWLLLSSTSSFFPLSLSPVELFIFLCYEWTARSSLQLNVLGKIYADYGGNTYTFGEYKFSFLPARVREEVYRFLSTLIPNISFPISPTTLYLFQ